MANDFDTMTLSLISLPFICRYIRKVAAEKKSFIFISARFKKSISKRVEKNALFNNHIPN